MRIPEPILSRGAPAAHRAMRVGGDLLARLGWRETRVDGYVLDPHVRVMLALDRALALPSFAGGDPGEARRHMRDEVRLVDGPPLPVGQVLNETLAGPLGPIPIRRYLPQGHRGPAPAVVWFHGGGWVIGDLETHDAHCRRLCLDTGFQVISVDYRLGPEHRFPGPWDDALAAFSAVYARAAELSIDPARIAVAGDSAGGNLSASISLRTRGTEARPALQVLLYPAVELTRTFRSHTSLGEGYLLDRARIDWFLANVIDPADYRDPIASPWYATDLSNLPPAIVVTAGFDPLRDEGDDYARKLSLAGNRVLHRCVPSLIHGFLNMTGAIPAADAAMKALHRDIREQLQ
jgi:acetyl esterase